MKIHLKQWNDWRLEASLIVITWLTLLKLLVLALRACKKKHSFLYTSTHSLSRTTKKIHKLDRKCGTVISTLNTFFIPWVQKGQNTIRRKTRNNVFVRFESLGSTITLRWLCGGEFFLSLPQRFNYCVRVLVDKIKPQRLLVASTILLSCLATATYVYHKFFVVIAFYDSLLLLF